MTKMIMSRWTTPIIITLLETRAPRSTKPMQGCVHEGIGKRIGMVEEVFAQRLITREGDLSAVEEKKHDFMCLCVCTIVQCWEGQT
jgi:hypothetical protein